MTRTRTEGDGLCFHRCLQREPRARLEADVDVDAEQSIPWAPALVWGVCVSPKPLCTGTHLCPWANKPQTQPRPLPCACCGCPCLLPALVHHGAEDGATSLHLQLKAWGSPGTSPKVVSRSWMCFDFWCISTLPTCAWDPQICHQTLSSLGGREQVTMNSCPSTVLGDGPCAPMTFGCHSREMQSCFPPHIPSCASSS